MRRRLIGWCGSLVALMLPMMAQAGSVTSAGSILTSVFNSCVISSVSSLTVSYNPTTLANAANATVAGTYEPAKFRCTALTSAAISLGNGATVTGAQRYLTDGKGHQLPYTLQVNKTTSAADSSAAYVCNTTGICLPSFAFTTLTGLVDSVVYVRMGLGTNGSPTSMGNANLDVPPGAYSDTVVLTVSF